MVKAPGGGSGIRISHGDPAQGRDRLAEHVMVDQSSDWLKLHCEGGNFLLLLNENLGLCDG